MYAPSGTTSAFLTTVVDASDPFAPTFSDASDAASIELSLGLAPDTIQSPNGFDGREGSMLWQTFTVASSSTLSFDWNLFSMEPGAPPTQDDFLFVALSGVSESSPAGVIDLLPLFVTTVDPTISATDWQNFSIAISTPGSYRLAIGVFDAGDDTDPSAVMIDDVVVIQNPEPNTASLLALGLVALGIARRR